MHSIRVKNLRSLADTADIKIKPITLLLGQNSSGKSTYLRTFPLLKQSTEVRTIGPILWYGRLVDFGSFEESASRNAPTDPISFEFKFNLNRRARYKPRLSKTDRKNLECGLVVKSYADPKTKEWCSTEYSISLHDHHVVLVLDKDFSLTEFKINGTNYTQIAKDQFKFAIWGGLIPRMFSRQRSELNEMKSFENFFIKASSPFFHGNTDGVARAIKILESTSLKDSKGILSDFKQSSLGDASWRTHSKGWTTSSINFRTLLDYLIGSEFESIMDDIGDYFDSTFRNIRYVTPLRASAERYYRKQDLAVDEIDPQGQNLAMYLRNMSEKELTDFSNWTKEQFNFVVNVISQSGHISLRIADTVNGESYNLADTGFGYSQMLPILAQLWSSKRSRYRYLDIGVASIFAIEQPELHLHPRLQAKLADAFVSSIEAANAENIDLRLVIETHSEAIVNRLGAKIAAGEFSADDVNIVLFEKESFSSPSSVRFSKYDANGYLENWPWGFFEAGYK